MSSVPLSRRSLLFSLLALSACSKKTPNNHASQNDPPDNSLHEVIIVGAGIAGLSAAYLLRDLDAVVLESQARPGGRALDASYAGISFPKGARLIGKPDGPLATIISELALNPIELPSPLSSCLPDPGSRTILSGLTGLLQTLNPPDDPSAFLNFLKALRESVSQYDSADRFDPASAFAQLDSQTAREWFVQRHLPSAFQDYFSSVARSRFGCGLDDLSALGFLPGISLDFDSIKDNDSRPQEDPHSGLFTFANGISDVTNALAKNLGDRLRFGLTVEEIRPLSDSGFEVIVSRDNSRFSMRSRAVLIAIPAPVATKVASNVLSNEQRSLLSQIRYAHCATACLFSDSPIWDKSYELLMPASFFFPSLYNAAGSHPEQNRSNKGLLVAHLAPRSLDDSLLDLSDDDLIDRVKKQLDKIFPDCSSRISYTQLTRFPNAYPVMSKGSHARLKRLHETLGSRVQLAGDYLIFPTFESAIDSARLASNRIRNALKS